MANTLLTRCFISYSRTDSKFVDRLEADLRAREFETWVDRRRLEGAQNWEEEIFRGIDWCSLMIVVLSPEAVASEAVEREWRYALTRNKTIIPLLLRKCQIPSELDRAKIQRVDDFYTADYPTGLKRLLTAIADQVDGRTSLPTDSRELYRQAIEARRRGELEHATTLLLRLVDRDPGYANGEAARDLAALNERLYPERARRLREEAQVARSKGEYGREAGALEALIALGPKDAWAEEYLNLAQRNWEQLETYNAVQDYLDAGDLAEARAKLRRLWKEAPFFRDPKGLAPAVGLASEVPITYEEAKDRRLAANTSESAKAKLRADFQARINYEAQRFQQMIGTVSRLTQAWSSGQANDSDRGDLDMLERVLDPKAVALVSSADALLSQFVSRGRTYLSVHEAQAQRKARLAAAKRYYDPDKGSLYWLFLILWPIVGIRLFVGAISDPSFSNDIILSLILSLVVGGIAAAAFAFLASILVFPLLLSLFIMGSSALVGRLEENALSRSREAASAASQWRPLFQKEHEARVQQIESERDTVVAAVETQHLQRMAEIAQHYPLG